VARDLTPLLFPRSVAVVGASERTDSLAGAVLRNLVAGGFVGPLAGVNPKAAAGPGMVPSLDALSFVPDLTVWGVPIDVIERHLPLILDKGARAHLVLSAGFSETGADGATREREIVARVREANGLLVGPNCMGLNVARPGRRLDASFSRARPAPGPTALLVQSGSVGEWLVLRMNERRLGAALVVSLGNMGDLDAIDFLESVPRSFPEVRQVVLYLETPPEAERLRQARHALPPEVRVLALLGGRTRTGARAVLGHTGALAEEPSLVAALFESLGIQSLGSLTEVLDVLELLQRLGPPRGDTVCVVTNAGAPGVLVTDALVRGGLTLPETSPALADRLRPELPAAASLANPIDLLASATPVQYERILTAVADASEHDLIVPVFMHPVTVDAGDIASAMTNGLGPARDRAVVCWMAGNEAADAGAKLRAAGLAVVEEPARLGQALARWAFPPSLPAATSPSAFPPFPIRCLPGGTWGDPEVLETALESPHLRIPPHRRLAGGSPSPELAREVGFPLYVKAESDTTPHKASSGLLVRVEEPGGLERAIATLGARLPERSRWLLQHAVSPGQEIYAGYLRHPRLGSFVAFGPGGREVTAEDVTWVALPASPKAMWLALSRGAGLFWSGPAAEALLHLLVTLSGLETEGVAMAEVNPAIWDSREGTFWIVDARWQPIPEAKSAGGKNTGPASKAGRSRRAETGRPL
jgi:acetate---CoA ligase (ADP-forming)